MTATTPTVSLGSVALAAMVSLTVVAPVEARDHELVSVGDSLAVGVAPHLGAALPGWSVRSLAAVGRHAEEGPAILRGQRRLGGVIAVSLGTNDDPRQVTTFRRTVRQMMAIVGGRRCVVWLNIARPAVGATSYRAYNRVLRREAERRENLRVVDWLRIVRAHGAWRATDGVHLTSTGYVARARATARAVKGCRLPP